VVGEHPVLDPGAGIEQQVEPLVAWMRAPAESSNQTIGMR
jgi:hypothetical protein